MRTDGNVPAPMCLGFRFSLRVFLASVITVSLGLSWLGWQAQTVRQRDSIRREANSDARKALLHASRTNPGRPSLRIVLVQSGPAKAPSVSPFRKWLGDTPAEWIVLATKEDAENARQWFPEATIQYFSD